MNAEEINQMAKNFQRDFNKLIDYNQKLINDLPPEFNEQKAEIQKDLEKILSSAKNNDISGINEIITRYGSSNNR
jgi:BMFP domain-containing protein YqiC